MIKMAQGQTVTHNYTPMDTVIFSRPLPGKKKQRWSLYEIHLQKFHLTQKIILTKWRNSKRLRLVITPVYLRQMLLLQKKYQIYPIP